jgi:hypothetical protein
MAQYPSLGARRALKVCNTLDIPSQLRRPTIHHRLHLGKPQRKEFQPGAGLDGIYTGAVGLKPTQVSCLGTLRSRLWGGLEELP